MIKSSSKELKEEFVEDFNAVVSKAEQFLESVSRGSESKASSLSGHVARNLRVAKDSLRDVEEAIAGKTRLTARAADVYAHENPWRTVGVGAGFGVAIGVLLGVLFSRR